MSYYEDEDKITYDRADRLVRRYIRERQERRTHVTCRDVAEAYEVEVSHHNLIRINDALARRLEVHRPAGSKATQYKLER